MSVISYTSLVFIISLPNEFYTPLLDYHLPTETENKSQSLIFYTQHQDHYQLVMGLTNKQPNKKDYPVTLYADIFLHVQLLRNNKFAFVAQMLLQTVQMPQ